MRTGTIGGEGAPLVVTEGECLSPHVAMIQNGCARLSWHSPFPGVERVRVLAWTCSCKAMVYELCQAGGRTFIRRVLQREGQPEIRETYRWSPNEAQQVWSNLLSGHLR